MIRRLIVGLLATGLLAASPAFAGPNPETIISKNEVRHTIIEWPACELGPGPSGPLYLLTTTTSSVSHVLRFDDGSIKSNGSFTAKFTAVPYEDPSLPSYTGTIVGQSTGQFDADGLGLGTATGTLTGTGSDGSKVRYHFQNHFSYLPDGVYKYFEHCNESGAPSL
jgi:hypothetical protein